MMTLFRNRNFPTGFAIFAGLVTLLTLTLNMINGRFWLADFKVYYSAAQQLLAGGSVYLVSFDDGSGFYKYSPAILYFFLPYTLFSYKIASVIHFFILGFVYFYTFQVIHDLLKKYFDFARVRREQLLISLAFICILLHFSRELYLGNINIVMLLFCCLGIRNFIDGRRYMGGLFLGLVFLSKPFFMILLIPLLLRKNPGALSGIAVVLISGILLPFLYPGPVRAINLYADWFKTIFAHNTDYPGMNSLEYILRHYLYPSMPAYAEYIIILTACVLAGWFILSNLKREQTEGSDNEEHIRNILFEWFILLAILPDLLKTDWVQFVLSAPVIMYMIFYIAREKKFILIPLLVLLLFFFSANSDDLLGRGFSRKLLEMGMMGMSNIMLAAMAMVMYMKARKR